MRHPATRMGRMCAGLLCLALLCGAATPSSAQPAVSFASWLTHAGEGSAARNVEVGLTLSPAPTTALTIKYGVRGSATAGSDHAALSGTVSVPKGATTAAIPVTVLDDSAPERRELILLTLVADAAYRLGHRWTHLVYIQDDDTPVVSFASVSQSVDEGGGTRNLQVTLDRAPTSDMEIIYRASGTATPGSDFSIPGAVPVVSHGRVLLPLQSVLVSKGATTATIPVTIIDDGVKEARESILLRLFRREGIYRVGTFLSKTFIVDNDTLPAITVAAGASPVTEGGDAVFTVTATPAPAADLAVSVDIAADGAYGITAGKRTVTVPTTGSATLTLATTGDEADEPHGSVTATVAAGAGYTVGAPASGTVAIEDDDAPPPAVPAVTIAPGASPITEGADAVFTVTATPAPAAALAVTVTVAADGDYGVATGSRTVTVPPAGSATLTLATTSDDADEPHGSVTATVAAGTGYTVGAPASGSVAVRDDDDPPPVVPAVTIAPGAGVTEGGDAVFTVTATPTPAADLAVTVTVAPAGAYGVAAGSRTVTVPPAGSATLTLATTDDDADEPHGSVTATVAAGPGYTVGAPASGSVAVRDDDDPPPVVPAVTIAPGAGVTEGGDAVFTVTATPAPAADLAVTVTVAPAGDFGVASGRRTVTVPTTGSATVTLATTDDAADEPDGSVTVTVKDGEGYTVVAPASGTVAIADDDPAPTPGVDAALVAEVTAKADGHSNPDAAARLRRIVKGMTGEDGGYTAQECRDVATSHGVLSTWKPWCDAIARREAQPPPPPLPAISVSAGAGVTEGGDAVFTVTASPAPAADLAVTVVVAVTGDFGIAAGSQSVTVPTTGSATLTLATKNDDTDEPDGSVTATVAAGAGYTVGAPASGSVAIADDDVPPALPVVTVSAGARVTEGGDATFTVTAHPAPASPLAVSLTVAAKGDYGIASGTRTVSVPTAGSATLTLATSDDAVDEPDGSVAVTLKDGAGYTVGSPASGSVSIADDDLPPPLLSIAANAASVTEGGAAAFTLTADYEPNTDLTVTLSVAETGGGDHVAAADEGSATAVIARGTREAAFSVATVDDDANEPDGSVTVTLKAGGGYTVSPSQGAATVTVSDNDAAALPSLSIGDVTVTEGAWMEFTVRLSAPSAQGASVKVSTRDSTPVSASARDYWPISGRTVRFRAGESARSVGVVVFDDSHDEGPETFEVVLSDPRGAVIGDGVAVGTIVNDDPMPAAWLARFGRTVAEQALDGIAGRMSADRTPGLQGSIAGQALVFGASANDDTRHMASGSPASDGTGALALAEVAQAFGGRSGGLGPGGFGHDAAGFGHETQSRDITGRDALLGSSFSLTGATDGAGGSMALWGRGSQARFDGREGTFSLDGEVTTGMLGADYARGKWLVGLALAQSAGEGDYRDSDVSPRPDGQSCPSDPEGADAELCRNAVRAGDGSVEASLTAAIPYSALQASKRLKLWGAAGYGTGEVTLETAMGGSYKSDTRWSMAAAGLRGDLLAPPAEGSGPALAVTSDALWTRSSSEKTDQLAASDSDATRLRLGLEGSYRMALEDRGHVTPKLEVGARHDGGDAETGFGVELGGGVAWSDPALGLSLDVSGRTLIAHGNDDLEDRGYAVALAFDPDPATQRGPSLSVRQEFGGQAQGGLDALFQPATLADRTGGEASARWTAEAAYGLPAFGGRFTGSPHVGLGLAAAAHDYSLGWRLTPEGRSAANVSFGLKATRRESDAAAPEHTVGVEMTARW